MASFDVDVEYALEKPRPTDARLVAPGFAASGSGKGGALIGLGTIISRCL